MKIEFELTKEDLLEFYVFHTQNDNRAIKAKKGIGIYLPIILFVLATLQLIAPNPNYFIVIMFYILGLLYILMAKRMSGKGLEKRIKPMFDKYDNSGIIGNHIITLSDESIIDEDQFSIFTLKWNGIKGIEENEKFYFLYVNSFSAIIIPKEAITDLYQFEQFMKEKVEQY